MQRSSKIFKRISLRTAFRLKRIFLYGSLLFTGFFIIGFAWVVFAGQDPYLLDPNIHFQDEGNPHFGSFDSSVTIRVYGDFSCKACKDTWLTFREAMRFHQADVFFVWNDAPNDTVGFDASIAGRCAQEQGRFWPYADALYEEQGFWLSLGRTRSFFIRLAEDLGLQGNRFGRCLDRPLSAEKVRRDLREADTLDLSVVPVFFFNKSMHTGGLSRMQFEQRLNLVR